MCFFSSSTHQAQPPSSSPAPLSHTSAPHSSHPPPQTALASSRSFHGPTGTPAARRAHIPISLSLDAYRTPHPGDEHLAAFPSSILLASSRGLPPILEDALVGSDEVRSDAYVLHPDSPPTPSAGLPRERRPIPLSMSGINRSGGISLLQAGVHKLRGNLGPGALALPGVFAQVGPFIGIAGLLMVCVPGICGLLVLVGLKRRLNISGKPAQTFEDVAFYAFGPIGRRLLETCIVCLQLGVALVYFGVLSEAACAVPALACENGAPTLSTVLVVSAVVLPCAFITKIASLLPLSLPGNIAILSAILGSVIKAIDVLSQPSLGPHGASLNATSPEVEPVVWPNNPMKVPVFLGAVFYAFEGIALVLPIENSLSVRAAKASSCFGYEELVVTAMSTVVLIFAIIGTVCGRAFPHASGSVVAYLAMEYPHSPTLQVLNGAVAAAVLCSFPLQLAPAMPAIEQACCSHVGFESYRWWHTYLIRTFIVFGCACIILVLPDVQMLVALTGALTTTTITAFPFIMQLKLAASRAIAPLRCGSLFLAIWVIIFSFFVMCLGTFTALRDIIESFK